MPKILILTASIGDGHNTAARNIRDAIQLESGGNVETLVADPYTRTNPVVNRLVQKGYTMAINKYPRAWKVVFDLLSKPGVVEGMGPMLSELKAGVQSMINEFQPDVITSTYPIFSYLVAKLRKKNSALTAPLFTIVTDSTMINSAWYRHLCDGFIVTDHATANVLRHAKVPEHLIHTMGFPVSVGFEKLQPATHQPGEPWKIIFFPGGRASRAIGTLKRLATIPNLRVTVVTGKRQGIFTSLQSAGLPENGELIGWTDNMPELMASHHLFVGKAGGATVQEAIAARLPFLVSHVVPGQEEGNIALIERTGIGALATGSPSRIGDVVEGAVAFDGTLWKAWRSNIEKIARPSASRDIARFLIERIPVKK
jgi:processive 1,2-diacylglycerol beta-glucosyltransferase